MIDACNIIFFHPLRRCSSVFSQLYFLFDGAKLLLFQEVPKNKTKKNQFFVVFFRNLLKISMSNIAFSGTFCIRGVDFVPILEFFFYLIINRLVIFPKHLYVPCAYCVFGIFFQFFGSNTYIWRLFFVDGKIFSIIFRLCFV